MVGALLAGKGTWNYIYGPPWLMPRARIQEVRYRLVIRGENHGNTYSIGIADCMQGPLDILSLKNQKPLCQVSILPVHEAETGPRMPVRAIKWSLSHPAAPAEI